MLGDSEIRQAVHEKIKSTRSSAIVLDELQVCCRSIVDIAVLSTGFLGIEIKSDKDTLNRLPDQITDYNKVFDSMIIVLGKCHYDKAINMIPDWWGVWIAEESQEMVVLHELKKAKRNHNKDNFSLSQFLWREEAIHVMNEEGILAGMKTKRKWLLWDKIAQSLTTERIFHHVKNTLLNRHNNQDWKNQLIID